MTLPDDRFLAAAAIADGLATRRVGRRVLVLATVDSTNLYVLRRLGDDPANDGLALFAEHQTAGRGRHGRSWESPTAASLMGSILINEDDRLLTPLRLMTTAGIAAIDAIHETTGVPAVLRWPNDLYVAGRKLGGILIETRRVAAGRHAVAIGIGINCTQAESDFSPDIRARATSLRLAGVQSPDRVALARALLRKLDDLLADPRRHAERELADAWRARSADVGAEATLQHGGHTYHGRILACDPLSGILLALDSGEITSFAAAATTRI